VKEFTIVENRVKIDVVPGSLCTDGQLASKIKLESSVHGQ